MSDTLTLSVAGHEYVIPQPSARVGLAQVASFTIAMCRRAKTDPPAYAVERFQARYGSAEHDMDQDALGPAWEEMQDELTLPQVKRAAMAAHVWIATGSERAARAMLDDDGSGGDDPKAGTTTAAAPTTKKRASGTGTKSRAKSATA